MNPIYTLEPPESGQVLVARVTWHHPLVCKGSSNALGPGRFGTALGPGSFGPGSLDGGHSAWASLLFCTPQFWLLLRSVACKRERTLFGVQVFSVCFQFMVYVQPRLLETLTGRNRSVGWRGTSGRRRPKTEKGRGAGTRPAPGAMSAPGRSYTNPKGS